MKYMSIKYAYMPQKCNSIILFIYYSFYLLLDKDFTTNVLYDSMAYMIVPEYKPLPLSAFLSDDVDFENSTTKCSIRGSRLLYG
jgi:hypothetical protein